MSLTDFTGKIIDESVVDSEIFKYIPDKRILRVLFENKIFKLRDIQKEAIQKGLFFQKSFLVCAPSGSGKTFIGEVCAIHNIFQQFGKSIYLVPFKALATEKYFHFKKSYTRYDLKVELSIGDYDIDDSKLEMAIHLRKIKNSLGKKGTQKIILQGSLKDSIIYEQSQSKLIGYLILGIVLLSILFGVVVLVEMFLLPAIMEPLNHLVLISFGIAFVFIVVYRNYSKSGKVA
ncbi:hypothetical protein LCGC14_2729390 [marine sediment metagenome]|uniref:DEAD/DEAH-box helicase domain-containing protein n=1 Tax=marine sediment metagenome TaxID=412755 RepID=A0A0F8Z7V6_9ZZZZ